MYGPNKYSCTAFCDKKYASYEDCLVLANSKLRHYKTQVGYAVLFEFSRSSIINRCSHRVVKYSSER